MHVARTSRSSFGGIALVLAAMLPTVGCAVEDATVGQQESNITEGTIAHGYAEAVHVNMVDEYGPAGTCSGALIGPRVVLTAGHCIHGYRAWGIYAPFAGRQGQMVTKAEVYDWDVPTGDYSFEHHDVGVILLDEPIELEAYPEVAFEAVEHGSEAVIVGRTKRGFSSLDWLFASEPVVLLHEWIVWPESAGLYYTAPEKRIESGDSGGAVYAYLPEEDESAPRTIVGLVSTTHHIYRVEHLQDWITSFLDEP